MAYPEKLTIQTSYTAVEQSLGDGSLPGQELDVDLAALRASAEDTIDFIKQFTRSDGKLANGIVTQEALAASVRIGFDPPAPWGTGNAYTTRSTVFQGFGFYLCTTAHTSGVFATDLAAGRWQLLADLTPPGGGLIAANNLSDLADASAARSNLGLGTLATANSGTAGSQYRTNAQNEATFQPLDATLTAVAGLSGAADQLPYFTGADALALTTITTQGRQLIDDTSFANMRTTLGLVIGTDVQAFNARLASIAGITFSAGDLLYATGASTLVRLPIGSAGNVLTVSGGAPAWVAAPSSSLTFATPQTTTSGTNFDFGSIPAGVTEVEVVFRGVSLSGTDNLLVQLGTSGGFVTTGYSSFCVRHTSTTGGTATSTAGNVIATASAVDIFTGTMRIVRSTANTWTATIAGFDSASQWSFDGGGDIALAGALTQVRITRTGSNTFDAGSVNVGWR